MVVSSITLPLYWTVGVIVIINDLTFDTTPTKDTDNITVFCVSQDVHDITLKSSADYLIH